MHVSPVVPPPAAPAASAPSGGARRWATVQAGPVLEEWQLPARYRRLPMEEQEIECINVSTYTGAAEMPPTPQPNPNAGV